VGADLFKSWSVQSLFSARGHHSLDAAAPMFDQPQFLKYATDHAVPQLRNSLLDVLNGQAEGK
jgi:hypothetical protein